MPITFRSNRGLKTKHMADDKTLFDFDDIAGDRLG
jgi:hypothetical protein